MTPDHNFCSKSGCPWLKKRDCTVTFVVLSPVILLFPCTISKAPSYHLSFSLLTCDLLLPITFILCTKIID
ncbi:unnamed protein product [Taenia asiatica]|uniref:Uncharacterized protein n=1 Tax=Taenia asiatica TaxID=60517 RepID=A0A3P6Q6Z9_TAEAS|nr:unnamed protein product [Taenia asiatica]